MSNENPSSYENQLRRFNRREDWRDRGRLSLYTSLFLASLWFAPQCTGAELQRARVAGEDLNKATDALCLLANTASLVTDKVRHAQELCAKAAPYREVLDAVQQCEFEALEK